MPCCAPYPKVKQHRLIFPSKCATRCRLNTLELTTRTWVGTIAVAGYIPLVKGKAVVGGKATKSLADVVGRFASFHKDVDRKGVLNFWRLDMHWAGPWRSLLSSPAV